MFTDLKILNTASAMAQHAVDRHALIAENIANADTPGYKARDLEPFSEAYAKSQHSMMASPQSSISQAAFHAERIKVAGAASPNGNTVSLEDQMTRSTAAARDHDTALTVYAKSLSMLRAALGRR